MLEEDKDKCISGNDIDIEKDTHLHCKACGQRYSINWAGYGDGDGQIADGKCIKCGNILTEVDFDEYEYEYEDEYEDESDDF